MAGAESDLQIGIEPGWIIGMSKLRAIGLMSGTSMDGVDVAIVETDGETALTAGATGFLAYSDADRHLLRTAVADAINIDDRCARPGSLAAAEAMIVQRHIEAVENLFSVEKIDRRSIDLVGFHGQTILHRPEQRLTVQLGDGKALAQALRIAVAYDFRAADVEAGGQGAPLVPVYHRALVAAAGLADAVVVINIGGVANLTFLMQDDDPIACDTGPGNALIDDLMLARTGAAVDRDGAAAAAGQADETILKQLLSAPYFDRPMPKSLDRNDFSNEPVMHLSTQDAAATLTAFTAASIARAFAHLPAAPNLAVVCGGGAHNPILMRELSDRLPCGVVTAASLGWSGDAVEAQAFAYLAVRKLKNLPITFPTTTGVARPLEGGVMVVPI
jgi:anhydro-N-acetylmuramic acid kinase